MMKRRSFILSIMNSLIAFKTYAFTHISKKASNMDLIIKSYPLNLHWPTQDPFLFCAYHKDHFPKGDGNLGVNASLDGRNIGSDFVEKDGFRMYHGTKVPGFPRHPHKGFETITLIKEGFIDHADSLGRGGRYTSGDCQWMTAGRGIEHSEMFPMVYDDKENFLEIMQIWINLPRKNKEVDPGYIIYKGEEVPIVKPNDKVTIKLYAGVFGEVQAQKAPKDSWAKDMSHQVAVWLIEIEKDGEFIIPSSKGEDINRSLYFYQGEDVQLNEHLLKVNTGVDLISSKEIKLQAKNKKASFLFLQGKAINEPVAQHGPFVLNSREDLIKAFEDYQKNGFDKWTWSSSAATHGKEAKRFAIKKS